MRAVVSAADEAAALRIATVPEPQAGPRDAIVDVACVALNPGELKNLGSRDDGAAIGWDFAGTVAEPSAAGGPPKGARVVGTVRSGAWAERVSVPVSALAVVPSDVGLADAVCLPVPGCTAYLGLRFGGMLLGKRVLITAAAGAVGQFACQFALSSGALVSAAVHRDAQRRVVRSHGVADVRTTEGIDAFEDDRFDLILDSIGGGVGGDAVLRLRTGGVYAVYSAAGGDEVRLPVAPVMYGDIRVQGFNVFSAAAAGPDDLSAILGRLLTCLQRGAVTAPVGAEHAWEDVATVAADYLEADDRSKPVLWIDEEARHASAG